MIQIRKYDLNRDLSMSDWASKLFSLLTVLPSRVGGSIRHRCRKESRFGILRDPEGMGARGCTCTRATCAYISAGEENKNVRYFNFSRPNNSLVGSGKEPRVPRSVGEEAHPLSIFMQLLQLSSHHKLIMQAFIVSWIIAWILKWNRPYVYLIDAAEGFNLTSADFSSGLCRNRMWQDSQEMGSWLLREKRSRLHTGLMRVIVPELRKSKLSGLTSTAKPSLWDPRPNQT